MRTNERYRPPMPTLYPTLVAIVPRAQFRRYAENIEGGADEGFVVMNETGRTWRVRYAEVGGNRGMRGCLRSSHRWRSALPCGHTPVDAYPTGGGEVSPPPAMTPTRGPPRSRRLQ